jgi:elongation factor P--(R)-beta-lysine ligase
MCSSRLACGPPHQMTFHSSATIESLKLRARLLSETRRFFDSLGYFEVDTPHLSRDICIDAWIEPLVLPSGLSEPGGALYLQTSPEFAMKRLLASGADAIYQLGHVFRGGERGPRHNPEFTMLEWYRVADTYHDQMTFTEEFVRTIASLDLGVPSSMPLPIRFQRISYDEAFEQAVGTRVLALDCAQLVDLATRLDVTAPESLAKDDRDGWLNLLLAERVEPWLTGQGAVFVYDYPATQSALARVRDDSPPVAERFELYLGPLELCNGYQELLDGEELERRMTMQNDRRVTTGAKLLPVGSRLLEAMRECALPPCSGVALGFDRLVMWRLGLERIDDAIPFPIDRA